jgi:hypothetical protein
VTYETGTFTIEPKKVTITVNPDGTYTVEGLNEEDKLEDLKITENPMENGNTELVPSDAVIRNGNGEDVTASYDITYVNVIREAEPVVIPTYRLTVRYWIDEVDGAQAAETFTALYNEGAEYNVTSPGLPGHRVSTARVSGIITADTTLDVIYTGDEYTLTIYYVYNDDTEAAPTYQTTLAVGESYSVQSPAIAGFNVNFWQVAGEMPGRNMTYTVRYWADNEHIIEDYDTALGIPSTSMSTGEAYD